MIVPLWLKGGCTYKLPSNCSISTMSFVIEPARHIEAAHLSPPVDMSVRVVEDKTYVALKKSDRRWERILVTKVAAHEHRSLPRTSIFETIDSLARQAFWRKVKPQGDHTEASVKKMKPISHQSRVVQAKAIMVVDTPATIEIPSIGQSLPYQMNILYPSPSCNITMIELTKENLEYLASVVEHQLGEGDEFRKRPRKDNDFNNDGVKGLSLDYQRRSLRVRVKDDGGAVKNKYFKLGDGEEDIQVDAAKSFIRGEIGVDDATML